jgi:hypothetical protein
MVRYGLVALLLLLTGCMSVSHYAVYQHPTTGDVLECEKAPASGGLDVYALIDLPNIGMYNACKTMLEERGYVRTGTEDREPTAKSSAELATPRARP